MALVQKQFGDLITFTRSSAGGRFNERGLFEMVPANQPRFDYDPITRQLRGLFTEETSTNLSTQSNSQLTITPTRATYIDNGQLFIDGVSPLRLLREDATPNATHFGVPPNTSLLADTTYTGSYFVKASGRTKLALWVGTSGGWAPGNPQANFDLVTQTVEERNGAKATISRVTQDIFRITLTAKTGPNPITSNIYPVMLNDSGSTTYDGDGVSGMYIGGYQVEVKGFATTYIPTTTAQVTRTADIPFINQLSPWWSPFGGTLYVDYTPGQIGTGSTNAGIYMSSESAADNVVVIRDGPGKGSIYGLVALSSSETQVSLIGARNLPLGTKLKVALSISPDSSAISVNGAKAVKGAGVRMPSPTRMGIGTAPNTQQLSNGHIRAIRYYPRQLTDAELEALTK
jgi:hypothetical protein